MEAETMPTEACTLIRNLERRKNFLATLQQRSQEEIPFVKIKDTFVRYLARTYRGRAREEIRDINRRIFALINRSASLANGNQDTAVVTSMYAYQYSGARPIDECTYGEFLREVKEITALCRAYNIKFRSVTGMQMGLGVPKKVDLEWLL